jgi:putative addiction module killer protein
MPCAGVERAFVGAWAPRIRLDTVVFAIVRKALGGPGQHEHVQGFEEAFAAFCKRDIIARKMQRDRATSSGDGVFELRLDFGPGYRIYFGRIGSEVILLLKGGDKSTQTRDIAQAQQYLSDYKDSTR